MTAEVVDSIPVTDNGDATSAVSRTAIPAEAEQEGTRDAVKRSRRSGTKMAEPRHSKKRIAALVGAVLTAAVGVLLAAVKLHQCRQEVLKNTSDATEGTTGRRLAAGGNGDGICVSVAAAGPGYRQAGSVPVVFVRCTSQPLQLSASP
ncbi:conserved hypothetical protein [Neospora caninum Liverpool]|uniref:Toxoplasma gondii family B protein n=1 Tax=Neospora caninum (strain Liverpool) TaxID=572307 RepID=F0VPF8_NEOCL|nr:conserved hypothetical protein [Neospora caninum Liverpool]CBZ55604.1 conserved hypothetical protein [Neospora caninum Liverpool]CEL70346.1 TPA: hypothetical protein BN1204_060290 [Neospora caninum Liverpool]|eukprot:XP_003885632.1 conserved hypothetical protein [Neospora caninum Liverpool]